MIQWHVIMEDLSVLKIVTMLGDVIVPEHMEVHGGMSSVLTLISMGATYFTHQKMVLVFCLVLIDLAGIMEDQAGFITLKFK